jgi:hypothetical protein
MAAPASESQRKVHNLVKRRLDHARLFWSTSNEMYSRQLGFSIFLEHYLHDHPDTKDRTRVQPKTQRQFNLLRHKAALLLRTLPQFDTHAVQPGADAGAAEVSKRIIDNVFMDPLKGYHDTRYRFVWSALCAGRGNYAIDWDPIWGVCFRFVDPRRAHITPGFTYMHDPRNPCVLEELPMRRSAVRRMTGWDVPSDLNGDGGSPLHADSGSRDTDGIERDQSSNLPGADENDGDDPLVTICKAWFREDPYKQNVRALRNADLPEDEWHFVDDTTQERIPFDPMNPVPPQSTSGAPMRLVTSRAEMNDYHSYPKGYLIITAPNYAGAKPLFEGSWTEGALNPEATLSVYPYAELTAYKHPLKREGPSDTYLTKSMTIIEDSTMRSAYEQIRQTGAVLVTKPGALTNSEGNQYQFTDRPIDIAYAEDILAMESTKFIQGPGMNPSLPAFWAKMGEEWAYIGTGDQALGPERSRDIAAATFNSMQQAGDLPVQLHQQDLNLCESLAARAVLDLCSAYMGDQVVSWVTDEGEAAYASVRGSDLVPLNVTTQATREWRQQDADKVQAQAQLIGMVGKAGLPPEVTLILLREAGMSTAVIDKLAEVLARAQMAPPMAAPPGPTGAPPANGPPADMAA